MRCGLACGMVFDEMLRTVEKCVVLAPRSFIQKLNLMPNVSSVLKDEITRVARRAVKAELDALRSASASYRREIAALKRTVATLQRGQASAEKNRKRANLVAVDGEEIEASGSRVRLTAKGLKTLRAKLGLSASEFGRLAGASGQSIYNWENGKNAPRAPQMNKIAALRAIGKREAKIRLEAMSAE